MNRFLIGLTLMGLSGSAFAAGSTCEAQATEKKLSGAAKTSFVNKCEKDAAAEATKSCDAQAAEKRDSAHGSGRKKSRNPQSLPSST